MIAKIVTKIGRLRAFPRVAVYMRNEAKHRDVIFLFKFYSCNWPSNLMELLSLRLVGAVGARINVEAC